MSRGNPIFSDEQVLAIMRSRPDKARALAAQFGMTPRYADELRRRYAKRARTLAQKHGLPLRALPHNAWAQPIAVHHSTKDSLALVRSLQREVE